MADRPDVDSIRQIASAAAPPAVAAVAAILAAGWLSWAVVEGTDRGLLLAAGLLIVLVLGVSVHLLARSRRLARRERRANRELHEEIAERDRFEAALRESEYRYRELIESLRDVVYTLAPDGTIRSLNPAFETETGWSRARWIGESFEGLVHPQDLPVAREHFRQAVAGGWEPAHEIRVRKRDGGYLVAELTNTPMYEDDRVVGVLGLGRNVTERRHAEEELRRSQKLELIGKLAAGIAHDFNNLLTVIKGNVEMARREIEAGGSASEELQQIEEIEERGEALVRQLLAFGRSEPTTVEILDLGEVFRGMERLVRRLLGEEFEVVSILAPDLPVIRADRGQVEQVILNLLLNARDAMPDGGVIFVEAGAEEIGPDVSGEAPGDGPSRDLEPGTYLRLMVTDSGEGIEEETRARIFDPFFTTRAEGTGLGLHTVRRIVRDLGGAIGVYSRPGEGTTFTVRLPATDEELLLESADDEPATAALGDETVLVVEDEESVLGAARRALEERGYQVLEARSPQEALRLGGQEPGPDLLLADVVLPHLSGKELLERLRRGRPGLPVLFMSGYSEQALSRFELPSGEAVLQKPFSSAELTRRVREVLDESRRAEPAPPPEPVVD